MHSCFTSFIFAARTLDFTVKFRFVFRYEAVVFRKYVLALLSVGLLRKFEAYPVYPSLIQSKNLRRFSFFQKFRHFTYMLLWFHLVIPSFPARIDDMRSRFFSSVSLLHILTITLIIIIIIIIYYLFSANIYMNIFRCALQVTLK